MKTDKARKLSGIHEQRLTDEFVTYMLGLLFKASRILSYRSDLGVLASCRHRGEEVTSPE